MRPRKYTDEQLLDAIRSAAKRLGRPPYKGETVPSATAFVHRFGSWGRAVQLAGLTSRRAAERSTKSRQGKPQAVIDRECREGRAALAKARRTTERAEAIRLYWSQRDPAAVIGRQSA